MGRWRLEKISPIYGEFAFPPDFVLGLYMP